MKLASALVLAAALTAPAADKPRIFITESGALQVEGNASVGDSKGNLLLSGPTSTENIEVIKAFQRHCPDVVVTGIRDKAQFLVRFDRDEPSPISPFVKGNKVAVFNKDGDLVYSHSTRLLAGAVKGACAAIARAATP